MFTTVSVGSYTGFAPSCSLPAVFLLCERGVCGDLGADSGGEGKCKHAFFIFLGTIFFRPFTLPPPPHPQLSAAGSPRMLQDVQGTAFPSFRIRFKITILMCEQNPYPDGVV